MKSPAAIVFAAALLAFGPADGADQQLQSDQSLHLNEPLLAPPRTLPPSPPRDADADAATYARCMALTHDDPAAAKKLAEGWAGRGGAHPADHCLAVALIGLKQYPEGATRLEKLGEAMIQAPVELRAEVFDQAAQAWLLAGDAGRAFADDGKALALRPDDPDLLIDRAEAAGSAGWYDKAVADLNRVLKTDPTRLDALIYRASAYRQEGKVEQAVTDIAVALKAAPDSVPALLERGNIRRLQSDGDGARQDWRRVEQLAPGSAAAAAAKANLERLDALGIAAPGNPPAVSAH